MKKGQRRFFVEQFCSAIFNRSNSFLSCDKVSNLITDIDL